jgi:hypothetical protein
MARPSTKDCESPVDNQPEHSRIVDSGTEVLLASCYANARPLGVSLLSFTAVHP